MRIKKEKMNIETREDMIIERKKASMKAIKISLIQNCFKRKEKMGKIRIEKQRS